LQAQIEVVQRVFHLLAIDGAVVILGEYFLQSAAVAGEDDGGEEADEEQDRQQPAEPKPEFMP
jgi:hypothetical protein